ncbi:MAG: thioredoxin family protein [Bacilli bacterium]
MKKILLIIVCLFIFTGCENTKMDTVKPNVEEEMPDTTYDSEYYKIISLSEFKTLYARETPTIIYFGRETCSACQSFKPIAKQFAKEKQTMIYFVDTDKLDQSQIEELSSLVKFDYVPYITIYQNKKQLYGDSGVLSLTNLVDLAITHGVLKK